MSFTEEKRALQAQINALHQKMSALDRDEVEAARESLKDLSWCRGLEVRYEPGSIAAGLPSHQLFFLSDHEPLKKADLRLFHGSATVWGSHALYENNIIVRSQQEFGQGNGWYTFDTSNARSLCEFIKEAGLKVKMEDTKALLYQTLLDHRA